MEDIGSTQVGFGYMRKLGGLCPINGARTDKEQALDAGLFRKVEDTSGTAYDRVEHDQRRLLVEGRARGRSGMNAVSKLTFGKIKITNITRYELQGRMRSEKGPTSGKFPGVA